MVLAAEASSANSFGEVAVAVAVVVVVAAAAAAAASGAVEVEGVVVEVTAVVAVGLVVAVAAVAAAAAGVVVGGRGAGWDAAEEDTTADVGEEGEEGEEGVRRAEGIEDTVPGGALGDILGEEGVACAFHKAVEVVEHEEVVVHREAATGEVP